MRLATLGLVACGVVLVWSHVAVAALAVCLNETPALAADLRQAAPPIDAVARGLLPLFAPLGVGLGGATPSCDAAAPARAVAVAGLAYVAGLVVLARSAIPTRLTWIVVGVVTAVIQLSLLAMPGLWSSDVLDYASHGRVAAVHAANPYVMTPADFPADPFARLGGWPDVVTVYGPLWTRLEVAITGALPDGTSVHLALAFKLLALASELTSAGLIFWIVRRWRGIGATDATPVAAVAMWVWNPLVNLETIGSAHNEAVMIVFVLLAFALLSEAARPRQRALAEKFLWPIALVCLWLGALVKFVPAGIEAIVALVWLRRATSPSRAFGRALLLLAALVAVTIIVAWPWLDSSAVAGPLLGLAAGGQRFKDVWQDAPAAWLTVRVMPRLGVPEADRMDVARAVVWSATRTLFVAYLAVEGWLLWRGASGDPGYVLRKIALASVRALLMAVLLYVSQVYAWYFLWPLPVACLLGVREAWSRAAIVFGLTFLPAFYLREFQSYGVFYMPIYAVLGVALVTLIQTWYALGRRSPARLLRPVQSDAGG
jgi:hypothetical protein